MANFKLYYTPTSCGAASFIAATLGDLTFDSETVNLATHTTKSGADFYAVNPKGNVPTLAFDDGAVLNENIATLTFLADHGTGGLAPKEGTPERYQYLNHISFVATELHAHFGAFFNPHMTPEARVAAEANLERRLGKLATMLDGKPFFNGVSLSAADIYAYVVLSWAGYLRVTLPEPAQAYFDGLREHAGIQRGLAALAAAQ